MIQNFVRSLLNQARSAGLSLIGCGLLLSTTSAYSSQLAQVALTDHSQLERLQRAGFDVSYYSPGGLAEVVLMNQDDRERLNGTGFPYFISIENLEAFHRSRLAPGRDDMGGYRTLDEIVAEMIRLHEDYPDIISSPIEIGQSIEDRPLLALRVSDNPDEQEDEPEALFTSLIHSREVVTSYVLFAVMEQLAEGYGNDQRLTRLVDERQTWFIPVVNPDGYAYNEEDSPDGGGMWRKNRRRNGDGTIGVDLNRNFGSHWGYDNTGSSPFGSAETYRGTEAFSEPETQGIREFVQSHRFAVSIFFHSYSNLCLYPYGYDVLQPPDRPLFSALARKMISVNHYLPGTGWEVIYRTNGDSDDWLYSDDEHQPIYAFTIEVGSRQDFFWPPLDRVEPLVAENIETVLTLIEYSDRPQRVLAPPIPEITRATITPNGLLNLEWAAAEDEHNPPVSYRIKARFPGESIVDDAPPDQDRWERVNFNMSQVERHSGTHSYRAALQSPMSTLTLTQPMVAPDTIRAWLNYTLRSNRSHCIALEASEDGNVWAPLAGDRTQDFVVNNRSIGPGIYGISGGWQNTYWLTGDYAGRVVKLRFRYYSFNLFPNPPASEFCYIDDISLFPQYRREDVIAEDIEDLRWAGRIQNHERELLYTVEAVDADDDESFFSVPVLAEDGFDPLVLRCSAGWSLVSAPFRAPDPSLAAIFAPWIERENLIIIKDGWGRFFLPAMNFDQIGEWSPIAGYFLKLRGPDTLVFPGEGIPADSPILVARGWSAIGYLPAVAMPAEQALDNIVEHLILAKNGFGEFWLVDHEFSNLRSMEPGMGFSVKMSEADTLIYPEPQGFIARFEPESPSPLPGFFPETPFNMSLLIDLPANHSSGSIRFFDGQGNLAGGANVDATARRAGVAVWREEREGGAGYSEGEPLRAFWRGDDGALTSVFLKSKLERNIYETDGFARLEAEFEVPPVPMDVSLSSYPNPFNGQAALRIYLAIPAKVTLEITDLEGRLVRDYRLGVKQAGNIELGWDASNLPNGLYFAKLTALKGRSLQTARIKMVLVK